VNNEEVYYARFKVRNNSFIFTETLDIIRKEDLKNDKNITAFGNCSGCNNIAAPDSLFIARLSRSIEPAENFDNLEPSYMKNFIIKEKKK
jgi:hypothetical protein